MTNKLSEKSGGGLIYRPGAMNYNGSSGYYSITTSFSFTNGWTLVGKFRWLGGAILNSGGINRPLVYFRGTTYSQILLAIRATDLVDGTEGTLQAYAQNNASTVLCDIYSNIDVTDGSEYSFLVNYDPVAGTAKMIINGVDGYNGGLSTVTTGTISTGSNTSYVGANPTVSRYWNGDCGFFGVHNTPIANYSDFFDASNRPKKLDETSWTEWGSQPLIWNPHGILADNRGSIADLTEVGIVDAVFDDTEYSMIGLPTTATATSSDILTGKTAWVDGVELVGNAYTPAMMQFNGSTGYYSDSSVSPSGNKSTMLVRFILPAYSADSNTDRIGGIYATAGYRCLIRTWGDTHATTAARRKLSFYVQNSAATPICHIFTSVVVDDNAPHTLLASYDGDTGIASMIMDGVDVLDYGNSGHVLTTGTLATVTADCQIGRFTTDYWPGQLGFLGIRDAYLTNWQDFMETDGRPKPLDETTWTEWGGQPLYWNEHGDMTNNLGSAGNMTKNGTIVVGKGGT